MSKSSNFAKMLFDGEHTHAMGGDLSPVDEATMRSFNDPPEDLASALNELEEE